MPSRDSRLPSSILPIVDSPEIGHEARLSHSLVLRGSMCPAATCLLLPRTCLKSSHCVSSCLAQLRTRPIARTAGSPCRVLSLLRRHPRHKFRGAATGSYARIRRASEKRVLETAGKHARDLRAVRALPLMGNAAIKSRRSRDTSRCTRNRIVKSLSRLRCTNFEESPVHCSSGVPGFTGFYI